jgi:type II secretory pathway component PulF
MAISTSQKSELSQVHPAADHNKQESSPLEKFVQQARSLPLFQKSRQITEKDRIFLFSQLALMLETGTPYCHNTPNQVSLL